MSEKSALILNGYLNPSSFLKTHLGIDNLFDYRIGAKLYKDIFQETILTQLSAKYDVFWINSNIQHFQIQDWRRYLDQQIPHYRSYRNIVLFPCTRYFVDAAEITTILNKLIFSDQILKFREINDFISIPVTALENIQNADRTVSNFAPQNYIETSTPFELLDSGSTIFKIWKFNTKTRYFNALEEKGLYIVKSCKVAEKARREFTFFNLAPQQIKPFFPALGQMSESSYQIEYLPMFDASRILIHAKSSPEVFSHLLNKIDLYFELSPEKSVASSEYASKFQSFVIQKMFDRVQQLKALDLFATVDAYFKLGHPRGVEGLTEDIASSLKAELASLKSSSLKFSHGDFCLSNILFDPITHQMKVIDPRGVDSFEEAFIPQYYDIAKLSHSILGHYEFITNGLSRLEIDSELHFKVNVDADSDQLKITQKLFIQWLEKNNLSYTVTRLVEASLFVSMMPLHKDNPKNLIHFFFQALKAFHEAKNKELFCTQE